MVRLRFELLHVVEVVREGHAEPDGHLLLHRISRRVDVDVRRLFGVLEVDSVRRDDRELAGGGAGQQLLFQWTSGLRFETRYFVAIEYLLESIF